MPVPDEAVSLRDVSWRIIACHDVATCRCMTRPCCVLNSFPQPGQLCMVAMVEYGLLGGRSGTTGKGNPDSSMALTALHHSDA